MDSLQNTRIAVAFAGGKFSAENVRRGRRAGTAAQLSVFGKLAALLFVVLT